jgi:hypothetical protein
MTATATARTSSRAEHVMGAHGIVYPHETYRAHELVGIPLSVLCAVLQLETSGGHNEYGHDPVKRGQAWGGPVTRDNYREYRRLRDAGAGNQGVGPMQLTSSWLQDQADRRGGCWVPLHNLTEGSTFLEQLHRTYGSWQLAAQHYNGSGPRAVHYGESMSALAGVWHRRFIDHA